jgi:hypothetical protein
MAQRVRPAVRLRQVANVVNLSTPLGLLLALTGRGTLARGPSGTIVAQGYRSGMLAPQASAVTIGDVVLLRLDAEQLARRPRLLDHEARHATQWACFGGVAGFIPAYLAASVWSWLRSGDFALRNPFEQHAGLVDGGYLDPPTGAAPTADPPTADPPTG